MKRGQQDTGCTLHVVHNQSGEEWTMPIGPRQVLNLKVRIRAFLRAEFGGELSLDGMIPAGCGGEYTATIYTDGRGPESGVCWTSSGFFVRPTYEADLTVGLVRPRWVRTRGGS